MGDVKEFEFSQALHLGRQALQTTHQLECFRTACVYCPETYLQIFFVLGGRHAPKRTHDCRRLAKHSKLSGNMGPNKQRKEKEQKKEVKLGSGYDWHGEFLALAKKRGL